MPTEPINLAALQELLTKEVSPQELKDRLDDLAYRYSRLALLDAEACGPQADEADDLVFLRLLRNAVAAAIPPPTRV
ncbi:MAG TPA: hypothetical protein PLS07_00690 [Niabella sp.]|nr:hypothetical protein [Niabella sp.]HQW14275.1 hypothetical protein [Niabella sp.]HQX18445.1 hypothetical protein [Niabella sp.]HQX40063.1 hypothetical protein [Niabella sp.]HRB05972.1 hypothetical protein [Niabella sp.]